MFLGVNFSARLLLDVDRVHVVVGAANRVDHDEVVAIGLYCPLEHVTEVIVCYAIGGVAAWLLGVSGVGLLIMGGWNLLKFIRGYRKRG